MGHELVSDRSSLDGGEGKNLAPVSFSEIFSEHLPFYLSIGMTPQQFWEDDYTLVESYREAWKLRQKEKNRNLWLQGLYIHEAFSVVMLNAFEKSGSPPVSYMKEPIALTHDEIKERKERDERKAYEQAIAETKAWMNAHNGKKKEVTTDGGKHD